MSLLAHLPLLRSELTVQAFERFGRTQLAPPFPDNPWVKIRSKPRTRRPSGGSSLQRRLATATAAGALAAGSAFGLNSALDANLSSTCGTGTAAAPSGQTVSPGRAAPLRVRVITFNTAVGNPRIKTPQASFADLPFYQDVIQGRPDAPILVLQEVGPKQLERLCALAKNGRFTVVHAQSRPRQGNTVLVPGRFEVLESESHRYKTSQVEGAWDTLKGWVKGIHKPEEGQLRQLVEARSWTEVELRDRESGRILHVFNTHLSAFGPVKLHQAQDFFEEVEDVIGSAPVVAAGDFNVEGPASRRKPGPYNVDPKVRALYDRNLVDMGPPEEGGRHRKIDKLLVSRNQVVKVVSQRRYDGNSISLPGSPSAREVSDHFAQEAVLEFS